MFWSFRIMIACGLLLLLVMMIVLTQTLRWRIDQRRWILRMTLWSPPLLWIVIEVDWFVMEFDRRPWVIQDILPTWYAHSTLSAGQLTFSIGLILIFYTLFLIAEIYLIQKYACLGPDTMHNQQLV